MRRATVRLFAVFVLALLGAPVAMHVVMHDLHAHHAEASSEAASMDAGDHADHEHPVVSSASPRVPSLSRAEQPVPAPAASRPREWARIATDARNVIAHGAIQATDDDVGLHSLLSTWLI